MNRASKPTRKRRRRRRRGRSARGEATASPATPNGVAIHDAEPRASEPPPDPKPAPPAAAETAPAPAKPAPRPRGEGAGRADPRRGPLYAALDLGTNNCRLLVARADRGGFFVVDAFSKVVRLGEGLNDYGALSRGAMDRAVAALGVCADRLRKNRVARVRAVATEACRRADNADFFLDRVRAETGLELDVISAEEEARLAVAGCAPLFDATAEELLVFDIGGGSTELIALDLSNAGPEKRRGLLMALAQGDSDRARLAARHIVDWVSLPMGVVTLGERFSCGGGGPGPRAPVDAERFEAMNQCVCEEMTRFVEGFGAFGPERLAKLQLLGASGTITTLAGVHLDLRKYSRRAVDGLWIAADEIDAVIERLVGLTPRQRAAIPCIGADRATNLMSGAAILRAILRSWPTRRLRVADRGLREGLLYGLIQDQSKHGRGDRRGGQPKGGC